MHVSVCPPRNDHIPAAVAAATAALNYRSLLDIDRARTYRPIIVYFAHGSRARERRDVTLTGWLTCWQ